MAMLLDVQTWSKHLAEVLAKHQNEEEGGFEHGMVLGTRLVCVRILQTVASAEIILRQTSLGFTENDKKIKKKKTERKYPMSSSSLGENAFKCQRSEEGPSSLSPLVPTKHHLSITACIPSPYLYDHSLPIFQ